MGFLKNSVILLVLSTFAQALLAQPATYISEGSSLFGNEMLRPINPSHYYEEQFLRDSTYTFLLDSDTSSILEWRLAQRSLYAYSPQGMMTSRVNSNMQDGSWQPNELSEYTYNIGNELIQTLKSTWDNQSKDWVMDERLQRFYNYFGAESERLVDKWDGFRWKSHARTTRDYGEGTNLLRRTLYEWDDLRNDWKPLSRILYTYNDGSMIYAETSQNWLDSVGIWLNDTKRNFYYDEDDNLIETIISSWDPSQDGFVADVLTTWGYNENGQPEITDFRPLSGKDISGFTTTSAGYNENGLLDELLSQTWDPETESWAPFQFDQHFWSTYVTGNPQANSSEIACSFANPYTQGLPWYCESLKADVQYTLDVYDVVGRHYHTTTFMGNHTFRVRAGLPSGFYLFVIRGGLDQHTEKVFVR